MQPELERYIDFLCHFPLPDKSLHILEVVFQPECQECIQITEVTAHFLVYVGMLFEVLQDFCSDRSYVIGIVVDDGIDVHHVDQLR